MTTINIGHPATSGYTDCACWDCFDTSISIDTRHPELCLLCKRAGCETGGNGRSGECQRADAHGDN